MHADLGTSSENIVKVLGMSTRCPSKSVGRREKPVFR
ncbi:hypothetical protein M3J09_003724 [Ascochyta lentis]